MIKTDLSANIARFKRADNSGAGVHAKNQTAREIKKWTSQYQIKELCPTCIKFIKELYA